MKKVLWVTTVVLVLIGSYFVYSRIKGDIEEKRRKSSYQAALIRFTQEIPLGEDKSQVEKYLNSQSLKYREVTFGFNQPSSLQIQIDELPPNLICANWKVYVVFEFASADKLREIHLLQNGSCL